MDVSTHQATLTSGRFRLSMLIYDTRYRNITLQIIALVLVLLVLGWLTDNVIRNLALKGKDINFGFLWQRAGYDIEQQLVPYTNDSPHIQAVLVGLLNTLVISAAGCVLATIIGVIVGVLRLSNNWLVSRLMTVYVEIFRNIPLLLWIILVFVVISETRPQPKDFRLTPEMQATGQEPAASMWLWDSMAMTNRGTNLPRPLLDHSLGTANIAGFSIDLTFWAIIITLAASFFVNQWMFRRVKIQQDQNGHRPTLWWKSLLVLCAPIALLLWALGFHLEYPQLKGFNFTGGIALMHSFTALFLALSLYTGAFIAEIVRSGILAVSRGQTEAAFALGLHPGRTMRLVILPQALRVIVPPLISQYLNLTKNTSLGIAVSYLDLRGTLGGITLNQTGRELECMLLMMLIYLVICLIISGVMNIFNTAIKLKER